MLHEMYENDPWRPEASREALGVAKKLENVANIYAGIFTFGGPFFDNYR